MGPLGLLLTDRHAIVSNFLKAFNVCRIRRTIALQWVPGFEQRHAKPLGTVACALLHNNLY